MPFKRSQSGFVLVATLWVLAALTLLASYIATIAETNVEIAIQTRAQINQKLDRMGTRATLIYLISTNATDAGGVSAVWISPRANSADICKEHRGKMLEELQENFVQ